MSKKRKIPDIIKKVKSGVCVINFYKDGKKINSGSGFLCKGRLISNNHVFFDPDKNPLINTVVGLSFGDTPSEDEDSFNESYEDFMDRLEVGSSEAEQDYAVFSLDKNLIEKRYQFKLGDQNDVTEGERVIIMGFPFGSKNLTSHVGYVSSIFQERNIKIIQLDASTNNGNSGGPVVDLKTLKAVAIVTRKQTGLAEQFDELVKSLDSNINLFQSLKQGGSVKIMGVDPIDYMQVSQNQMKILAQNIKRSANTGIGFAFSCERLKKESFYYDKTKKTSKGPRIRKTNRPNGL